MFKSLNRREWIVITIIFLFIPTICGLVLFHISAMTSTMMCEPVTAWNFLLTCIAGTNILMSVATGGIMIAVPILIYLIRKIIITPW